MEHFDAAGQIHKLEQVLLTTAGGDACGPGAFDQRYGTVGRLAVEQRLSTIQSASPEIKMAEQVSSACDLENERTIVSAQTT